MARTQVWILGGGTLVAGAAVALWLGLSAVEPPAPTPASLIPATPSAAAPTPALSPVTANRPEVLEVVPSFDVVRNPADGLVTVSGRVARGAAVTIRVDGVVVGEGAADSLGQFALLIDLGYTDTAQVMTLEMADAEGRIVEAPDLVLLTPRPAPQIAALSGDPAGPVESAGEVAEVAEGAAESDGAVGDGAAQVAGASEGDAGAAEPVAQVAEAAAGDAGAVGDGAAQVAWVSGDGAGVAEPVVQVAEAAAESAGAVGDAAVQVAGASGDSTGVAEPVAQVAESAAGDAGAVVDGVTQVAEEAGDGVGAVQPVTQVAEGAVESAGAVVEDVAQVVEASGSSVGAAEPATQVAGAAVESAGAGDGGTPVVGASGDSAGAAGPATQVVAAVAERAGVATAAPSGEGAVAGAVVESASDGAVTSGDGTSEAATRAEGAEPVLDLAANAAPPEAGGGTPTAAPLAAAAPTAILMRGDGRVAVLDRAPQVMDNVVIDAISYSDTGDVQISGRAAGAGASGSLRIYLDNRPVALARAERGDWTLDLPAVDAGIYTLRVDQLNPEGGVVSRFETPFLRESPEALAQARARSETAQPAPAQADDTRTASAEAAPATATQPTSSAEPVTPRPRAALITVQPGHTLWAISRDRYGEGARYMVIFNANRSQIRDPDLIYPGQVFALPDE